MKNTLSIIVKMLFAVFMVIYGLPCIAALIASFMGMVGMTVIAPAVMVPILIVLIGAGYVTYKIIKYIFKSIDGK